MKVNGREMTSSKEQLTDILENDFSSKSTEQSGISNVAQMPTEEDQKELMQWLHSSWQDI